MEHLCCHSRGPMKRENQPAAFFRARARQHHVPFTVAKKSPRSRRLDSFIHTFGGSMTRRRKGGRGTDRADWMTTSPDEKSESKNRASTIRLSAFRPAQRRPVLLTIARNKSKGPLRNADSATISRPLRVLASAFGYGSLKSEAWMRVQVMYGVSLQFRRDFSNLSYLR